jgi:hypothetical protein
LPKRNHKAAAPSTNIIGYMADDYLLILWYMVEKIAYNVFNHFFLLLILKAGQQGNAPCPVDLESTNALSHP